MSLYTPALPASSQRNSRSRAQFARAAVFAEFGHRNGRAIDQGNFRDRAPHQRPPTVFEVGRR